MIDVTVTTKERYIQNERMHKDIRIVLTPKSGTETTVGNNAIVAEQFELEQHLCDAEVDFVGCVSSTCKFTLWNIFGEYDVGTKVEVYILGENTEEIKVFTGYVNEVEANFENGEVEYICYDLIGYDYLSDWKFGDTLSEYLESHERMTVSDVFNLMETRSEQYNLDIVYDTLPNDIRIRNDEETGLVDTFKGMSALDILRYICQLQGLFGVINNEGQFELRQINPTGESNGAYPSEETYPSEELYPGVYNSGQTGEFLLLSYETFESPSRLTKKEPPVNGVLIMETEDSNIDKSADNRKDVKNYNDRIINPSNPEDPNGTPFTGSVIKIVGNPFIHDKSSDQKLDICNNIQSVAGGYTYYPFEAKGKGLPFIEVGDYVDYIVTDWNEKGEQHHQQISCLILGRTLKGLQHMTDTYSAKIVDDWKSKERIHYIMALNPATNVTEDLDSEYTEDLIGDQIGDIDQIIDEKIEDKGNIWTIKTVDAPPMNASALTVYLVRGIISVENIYNGTNISIPDDEGD